MTTSNTAIQFLGGQENGESLVFAGEPPPSIMVPTRWSLSLKQRPRRLLYVKREWQDAAGSRVSFYVLDGTSDAEAEAMMRAAIAAAPTQADEDADWIRAW